MEKSRAERDADVYANKFGYKRYYGFITGVGKRYYEKDGKYYMIWGIPTHALEVDEFQHLNDDYTVTYEIRLVRD